MGGQEHIGGGRQRPEVQRWRPGATEGHLEGQRERYRGWMWVSEPAELNHQSPTTISPLSLLSTFQKVLNQLAGQTVCDVAYL